MEELSEVGRRPVRGRLEDDGKKSAVDMLGGGGSISVNVPVLA